MSKKYIVVIATLLVIVLIGGATWVWAQASTDGIIHACVAGPNSSNQSKNVNGEANTGSVRIVNGEADCRNGEDYVYWNKEGPSGADGSSCSVTQNDGSVTINCTNGSSATVSDGVNGVPGTDGADGLNCWDLNHNGEPDPEEDINLDSFFDALDCKGPTGPQGPVGADGANGADGTSCQVQSNDEGAIITCDGNSAQINHGPPGESGPVDWQTIEAALCNGGELQKMSEGGVEHLVCYHQPRPSRCPESRIELSLEACDSIPLMGYPDCDLELSNEGNAYLYAGDTLVIGVGWSHPFNVSSSEPFAWEATLEPSWDGHESSWPIVADGWYAWNVLLSSQEQGEFGAIGVYCSPPQ